MVASYFFHKLFHLRLNGKNLDANLFTISWSTFNDHTNGHYGAIHLQADKLAKADNIGPRPKFQAGV